MVNYGRDPFQVVFLTVGTLVRSGKGVIGCPLVSVTVDHPWSALQISGQTASIGSNGVEKKIGAQTLIPSLWGKR